MTVFDDREQLIAACEAFLWTRLANNNPGLHLTEQFIAAAVARMIDAGVRLIGGELRFLDKAAG